MQITKEKLIAQQLVLFHLGYYKGLIDGIWSDASLRAKRSFEADLSFLPAFPNGGLPFGERDKLPKGMRYDAKGLIVHNDLPPEKAAEILSAMNARAAKANGQEGPVGTVGETSDTGGEGAAGVAGEPGPDSTPPGEVNPLAGTAGPEQKQHGQQQRHQHNKPPHKR